MKKLLGILVLGLLVCNIGLAKPKAIYFKHGIYRSFISKYKARNNGKMPTQIVFYDEIRRGNSIKKVDININPKLKPVD